MIRHVEATSERAQTYIGFHMKYLAFWPPECGATRRREAERHTSREYEVYEYQEQYANGTYWFAVKDGRIHHAGATQEELLAQIGETNNDPGVRGIQGRT